MSELNVPLSDYAKALESHVPKHYHKKISAVGIDPFLVPEKYFNPESLPPVESMDLVSFLVLETTYYIQKQFLGSSRVWKAILFLATVLLLARSATHKR